MANPILEIKNKIGQTISINDIVVYPTSATTTEIGVVTKISELGNVTIHPLIIKDNQLFLNDASRNKTALYVIQITNHFNYMSGTLYGNNQTFLYYNDENMIENYLKIELCRMYFKQFKKELPYNFTYFAQWPYDRILDLLNVNTSVSKAFDDYVDSMLSYNNSYKDLFNTHIKPFLNDLEFAKVIRQRKSDTIEYQLTNFNFAEYDIPHPKKMKHVDGPIFVSTSA
jgi:hypothetical protein